MQDKINIFTQALQSRQLDPAIIGHYNDLMGQIVAYIDQLEEDALTLSLALSAKTEQADKLMTYISMVQYYKNGGGNGKFLSDIDIHKYIKPTDNYYRLMKKALNYDN